MKKRNVFILTIGLVILLFFLSQMIQPDKLLDVGSQSGELSYEFTKEIKNKEKIAAFEKWVEDIEFTDEIDEPSGYAEVIVQVRHPQKGIFTHPISLWKDEDTLMVVNGLGFENMGSKISSAQFDELQKIIN